MHQGIPSILIEAPEQQALDDPTARHPAPEQPGGKHARVVDDEQVAWLEVLGQIGNGCMRRGTRRSIKNQQP